MRYRPLGRTGIKVSTVAMGCWALAGGKEWGDQDPSDIGPTIDAALDAGINFFDTAPAYGDAERLLGRALAGKRDKAVIATKVSQNDLRPAKVAAACERSLVSLGVEVIDLYQIHWPNHEVPLADTMGALNKLKEAGKIRAIGVSNFGPIDMADAATAGRFETNQMAYSMLFRAIEFEIVPASGRYGAGILCYSPLIHGLLTGKFQTPADFPDGRARTLHFSCKRPQVRHGQPGCEALTFETLGNIHAICDEIGQSMADVALAWCLHQPGITSVLAGARSPEQVRENARAGDIVLSTAVLRQLDDATRPLKEKLGPHADLWQAPNSSRIR